MIPLLHHDTPFPPAERALREPNGLLAAGANLTPARLLDAYRHGIFPWFNADDPILWWSPDPRMVLFPAEFKISRSLRKTLRRHAFEVRTDTAFDQVMRACAAPRHGQSGTWIHPEMIAAYTELHRMGYAHSVEVWIPKTPGQLQVEDEQRRQQATEINTTPSEHASQRRRGGELELAGGLYGIGIGRMFYGESMFSRKADASKIALAYLAANLDRWGFGMIDCQMNTSHLASLGAREIPRTEFIQRLQELIHYPHIAAPWKFDHEPVE